MLQMIMRLCFSTPRRLLVTLIVIIICGAFPIVPIFLVNGAINAAMPIIAPVILLAIGVFALRTMFGGLGGGRRRR